MPVMTPYQVVLVLEGVVQRGDPLLGPKHQDVPLLTKTSSLENTESQNNCMKLSTRSEVTSTPVIATN